MQSIHKAILLYVSVFLQSCSSIGANRSNINPIRREDVLGDGLLTRSRDVSLGKEGQPLTEELRSKLGRLRNERLTRQIYF